jgi:hypothetical protein
MHVLTTLGKIQGHFNRIQEVIFGGNGDLEFRVPTAFVNNLSRAMLWS